MRRTKSNNRRVLKRRRAKVSADDADFSTGVGTASTINRPGKKKRFATATKRTSNTALRSAPVQKKQSMMLKKQAQERMVLKEHLEELTKRKLSRVKGIDAKNERRQMGKYIKELRKQQTTKHAGELTQLANDQKQAQVLSGFSPGQAPTMHRKKQQRYLNAPVTVGLPHGRSDTISAGATPLPSNVASSVPLMVSTSGSASLLSRQARKQQVKEGVPSRRTQQRWQQGSGGGGADDDDENEWIDEGDQYSSGNSHHQQQQEQQQNQQQDTSNDQQLRQLFSGFGAM